ncbi:MAG: hypothetical protein R2712_29085 [Vicinamibacterales bacterium]
MTGCRLLPHPVLAPAIGRLARRAAGGEARHLPHELQPIYIRRPDVERP